MLRGKIKYGGGVEKQKELSDLKNWQQQERHLKSEFVFFPACKESSSGLVDFVLGQVNFVLNLPDGQVKFFEKFKLQKNCKINSAHQSILGAIVQMTFGLVNSTFSLPEWQVVKLIFFAPCFSLYHNHSYLRTLSNVSWIWIPRDHIQVQKAT